MRAKLFWKFSETVQTHIQNKYCKSTTWWRWKKNYKMPAALTKVFIIHSRSVTCCILNSAFLLFWIHENKNVDWSRFHEHENVTMVKRWNLGITVKIMLMLHSCLDPKSPKIFFFFIKSNSSFQIKSFQILVLKNYSKIVGVRWSRRVDHDHCLFLPNQVEHQQLTSSCASCTTRPSRNHALNPGCLNILLILITPRTPSSVYNIQYLLSLSRSILVTKTKLKN